MEMINKENRLRPINQVERGFLLIGTYTQVGKELLVVIKVKTWQQIEIN